MRGNVGDVALEPHQGPGSGDGGLIQGGLTGVDGDKPGALRAFLAGDDGPGPVGLSGQSLVVPGRAPLGVGTHRPPRPRVSLRVPHRLDLETLVPLAPGAPSGRDGVNDLPVGEGVARPVEVRLQVPGGKTCLVFCVSVLQVGVDSVGVGSGGAGSGPCIWSVVICPSTSLPLALRLDGGSPFFLSRSRARLSTGVADRQLSAA